MTEPVPPPPEPRRIASAKPGKWLRFNSGSLPDPEDVLHDLGWLCDHGLDYHAYRYVHAQDQQVRQLHRAAMAAYANVESLLFNTNPGPEGIVDRALNKARAKRDLD